MKMYIDSQWVDSSVKTVVKSPFSGEIVDTVPEATEEQVVRVISAAVAGARAMAGLTAYERSGILLRAADLVAKNVEDIARTISLEEGKPIAEARGEAARTPELLRLCAFEGTQIRGETLPLDAQSATKGKLGFTMRVPCGVVVAITPFNYPLLLVVHKVGPALAAGNSVILKPASQTPLTALKLTEILLQAGLPENGLQCITGPGSKIGEALCRDRRVRKISFTGSTAVGESIAAVAGVKKLSLELGANCPVAVMADADIEKATSLVGIAGYVNAGQVCISTQRVLVDKRVYADFLDAFRPKVEAIKVGPSLGEDTKLSAMISEKEAIRACNWIEEAVAGGARLVTGGEREGAVLNPTIVADVKPDMKVSCEELFCPAVAVTPIDGIDEAITLANASKYGLGAGVFTQNVKSALRFAAEVQCGSVMINWTSLWRADLMPYGGFKKSGIGKEGPRYAVEEMTEIKTVVFHDISA